MQYIQFDQQSSYALVSSPRPRRGGVCTSWKLTSCPSYTGLVLSRWSWYSFFKTSFFLTDFSNLAKKYFQPGNRFHLMQLMNATGLVGGARHLQEGAPLWNEIRISDVGPKKVCIKNNDESNHSIQFPLCRYQNHPIYAACVVWS